ncbi:hypothetical protein ACE6H2_010826 [Prunus campanulata]
MMLLSHVSTEGVQRKAWLVELKFQERTLWIWVWLPVEAENPTNMYSLRKGERSRGPEKIGFDGGGSLLPPSDPK